MNAPVLNIDSEVLEKQMTNLTKTMNKTKRFFDNAEIAACAEIAEQVKTEVDLFAPNVPIVVALCNPGMRDRHWETLSERTGKEIKPGDDFTLQKVR